MFTFSLKTVQSGLAAFAVLTAGSFVQAGGPHLGSLGGSSHGGLGGMLSQASSKMNQSSKQFADKFDNKVSQASKQIDNKFDSNKVTQTNKQDSGKIFQANKQDSTKISETNKQTGTKLDTGKVTQTNKQTGGNDAGKPIGTTQNSTAKIGTGKFNTMKSGEGMNKMVKMVSQKMKGDSCSHRCCPWWYCWNYPSWCPMYGCDCGYYTDVPVVAVDQGLDLQLLAVRTIDSGDPENQQGPAFRVWYRNNSSVAINHPFNVLVLAARDAQPTADLPQAGVRVDSIEAGQTQSVDIRLPADANQPGLPMLHVLVDSHREIAEINEANNGLVISRSEVLPVEQSDVAPQPVVGKTDVTPSLGGDTPAPGPTPSPAPTPSGTEKSDTPTPPVAGTTPPAPAVDSVPSYADDQSTGNDDLPLMMRGVAAK